VRDGNGLKSALRNMANWVGHRYDEYGEDTPYGVTPSFYDTSLSQWAVILSVQVHTDSVLVPVVCIDRRRSVIRLEERTAHDASILQVCERNGRIIDDD
jgi:hypothetical protein